MNTNYFYIVVTIDGQKCFINKDMDYTDNFSDVLRFDNKDDASDFVSRRGLAKKNAKIIEIVERV